jgi:hypothetical protein
MGLEQRYEQANAAERALKEKIWKAAAEFVRRHPEFVPSAANEKILIDCMSAPENDHLSPSSISSWEDTYAQCREKLYEAPAARKPAPRRAAPATTGLTGDEVNSWTSKQLQRELEKSPRRAAEIEAALSSGRQ